MRPFLTSLPQAILHTLPLCVATLPWGVLTGTLAIEAGFSAIEAQLLSLLVFAGAAQLSIINLATIQASLFTLFSSTAIISSRHLLYSLVFRDKVSQLSTSWRFAIAFFLTDEMFVLSEKQQQKTGAFCPIYALSTGIIFYISWNISTLIGIGIGQKLSQITALGFDFAIIATFITMTFDKIQQPSIRLAILTSGLVSALGTPIFAKHTLIVAALSGMSVAFFYDSVVSEKE